MEAIWKTAGLVIAALASVTGILGALYGIVTVPVLRTLKAEISGAESRIKIELLASEARLEKRLSEMEKQIAGMEHRLNERIDTRLIHR